MCLISFIFVLSINRISRFILSAFVHCLLCQEVRWYFLSLILHSSLLSYPFRFASAVFLTSTVCGPWFTRVPDALGPRLFRKSIWCFFTSLRSAKVLVTLFFCSLSVRYLICSIALVPKVVIASVLYFLVLHFVPFVAAILSVFVCKPRVSTCCHLRARKEVLVMSAVRTFLLYSKEASKLRGMWL